MGCGESKGTSKEEKIVFKHLGVHSLDVFFEKCDKLMKDFTDILEPLDTEK
jgi:hypothetical protein